MDKKQLQGISICKAQPEDANQIFQVQISSIRTLCSSDYTSEQIEALIDDKSNRNFIGEESGEIVFVARTGIAVIGFSSLLKDRVSAAYVHPCCVRQGVGTRLLNAVEGEAVTQNIEKLSVMASITARPFYQARGYRIVAQSSFISDAGVRDPCVDMEKLLLPPPGVELPVNWWVASLRIMKWVLTGR